MDTSLLRDAVASVYEDTPDSLVMYDRAGKVVATNAAAEALTGYAEGEMIGVSFRDHVAKVDLERIEMAVKTALAGGTDHFDTTVRHRDGSIVPVECYVFPARFGEEIVGFFAQGRDLLALRSAERSLTLNQQRFRSLFEYHPDGIMELKSDGSISRINVALESETGFYGEQILGHPWVELVAPEHRALADDLFRETLRGEASETDSLLLDRLGNRIDVSLKLVPLRLADEISGAFAVFKDITAQKDAERAIATQSERIRSLYLAAAAGGESLDDQIEATLRLGIELFDWEQAYVTAVNGQRVRIRNVVGSGQVVADAQYPLSSTMTRHVLGERSELFVGDLEEEAWKDDPARVTIPWRSYFGIRLVVFGKPFGLLGFGSRAPREAIDQNERDILQLMGLFIAGSIERALQNERIEQMAFTDALTGLPNRVLFNDRIANAIATSRRYDRGFAVMYLDVDNFKKINDQHGHAVGDAVLVEVASRLRRATRESDTVSRFGGDEFVILQPIVNGSSDAADLARKLNNAMQEPIAVNGQQLFARISCGIAMFPSDATTIEALIEAADGALYRAKREGRNRWSFANMENARRELTPKRVKRQAATE